jgi:hypothetical protein
MLLQPLNALSNRFSDLFRFVSSIREHGRNSRPTRHLSSVLRQTSIDTPESSHEETARIEVMRIDTTSTLHLGIVGLPLKAGEPRRVWNFKIDRLQHHVLCTEYTVDDRLIFFRRKGTRRVEDHSTWSSQSDSTPEKRFLSPWDLIPDFCRLFSRLATLPAKRPFGRARSINENPIEKGPIGQRSAVPRYD